MAVRVGVLGTSWWADAMYLPALRATADTEVVAVAGRSPERTADFASRWEVPVATTDIDQFFDQALDAVVIATANDSHHELTLRALEAGLDVLCEKPLGLDVVQAREMVDAATAANAITLVPFTYRYMPVNQWVNELISTGYIGDAHHLGLRYFTGFARDGEYAWRFDRGEAGSGVIGDIGSHFLHLAHWFLGPITAIGADARSLVERDERPDGHPYERGEDTAVMRLEFASGAYATVQVSAVCWEGTDFNQTHELDAHGTDGTLYARCDWQEQQEVRGVKADQPGPAQPLEIPDHIWGNARRGRVHDTYRDTFRGEGAMIGDFIAAVQSRQPCEPDFAEGLRIQQLCDAALRSAQLGGAMQAV